jgi:hypothetical protein
MTPLVRADAAHSRRLLDLLHHADLSGVATAGLALVQHVLRRAKRVSIVLIFIIFGAFAMTVANAATITFDQDKPGASPSGWRTGVTGRGTPKWSVEAEPSAPSPPHVLKQSGSATFPWCVKDDASLTDGYVEVKFKPLSGNEDQAGGVIWRFKDGDNYYVARANALEGNVSLYYTQGGRRITIKYVDAPVPRNTWHTLRAEFSGRNIRVILDGKPYIELADDHISGAGAVGVWTKADSVTLFDDFSYGAGRD